MEEKWKLRHSWFVGEKKTNSPIWKLPDIAFGADFLRIFVLTSSKLHIGHTIPPIILHWKILSSPMTCGCFFSPQWNRCIKGRAAHWLLQPHNHLVWNNSELLVLNVLPLSVRRIALIMFTCFFFYMNYTKRKTIDLYNWSLVYPCSSITSFSWPLCFE